MTLRPRISPESYDLPGLREVGLPLADIPYFQQRKEKWVSSGTYWFDQSRSASDEAGRLKGVVMVSVGTGPETAPVIGAVHARVARLQDLPSLIHACVHAER